MKIKRDKVEALHGTMAESLARAGAEQKLIKVEWA